MRSTEAASKERAKTNKPSRATEGELFFAVFEDEAALGRPHTPGEREAFTRGFLGLEYAAESGSADDEAGR